MSDRNQFVDYCVLLGRIHIMHAMLLVICTLCTQGANPTVNLTSTLTQPVSDVKLRFDSREQMEVDDRKLGVKHVYLEYNVPSYDDNISFEKDQNTTQPHKRRTLLPKLSYLPIRVHFELIGISQHLQYALQMRILPTVNHQLQSYIGVVPVRTNLTIIDPDLCAEYWPTSFFDTPDTPKCKVIATSKILSCGIPAAVIPPEHIAFEVCNETNAQSCRKEGGHGLPHTDTIMYITTSPAFCSETTSPLAFASTCYRDQHDRPIAGMINICESGIELLLDAKHTDSAVLLLVHEATHILGFSRASFPYFRDCGIDSLEWYPNGTYSCRPRAPRLLDGSPQVEVDGSIRGVLEVDERGILGIVTPRVIVNAQAYFDCDSVTHMPLEDEGDDGQHSNHWESRFLAYDLMNPSITVGQAHKYSLSSITLALLEDSGWYTTHQVAHPIPLIEWGRGHGCSIFQCDSQMNSTVATGQHMWCSNCSSPTFCEVDTEVSSGCSHDYLNKAICSTVEEFNGCGAFLPVLNGQCDLSNAYTSVQDLRTGSLETFGSNSRCFVTQIDTSPVPVTSSHEGQCFQHHCSAGQLKVQIGIGLWYHCERDGLQITVRDRTIVCMSPNKLCDTSLAGFIRDTVKVQFMHPSFQPSSILEANTSNMSMQLSEVFSSSLSINLTHVFVSRMDVYTRVMIATVELVSFPTNNSEVLRNIMAAANQLIVNGGVTLRINTSVLVGTAYHTNTSNNILSYVIISAVICVSFGIIVGCGKARRRRQREKARHLVESQTTVQPFREPTDVLPAPKNNGDTRNLHVGTNDDTTDDVVIISSRCAFLDASTLHEPTSQRVECWEPDFTKTKQNAACMQAKPLGVCTIHGKSRRCTATHAAAQVEAHIPSMLETTTAGWLQLPGSSDHTFMTLNVPTDEFTII